MTGSHLLYLMRHGAPAVAGRLLGRVDDPATEAGIAGCVARAGTFEFSRISCSDLRRTTACAAAIAATRQIGFEQDPAWRELDFGAWDGLSPSMVDPTALARFYDDPDAAPPPAGERWSHLQARIAGTLATMPQVTTLVVTHGGAIRAALAVLCGMDHRQTWAFDLPYTALVTLRIWPGEARTVQIVGLAT